MFTIGGVATPSEKALPYHYKQLYPLTCPIVDILYHDNQPVALKLELNAQYKVYSWFHVDKIQDNYSDWC